MSFLLWLVFAVLTIIPMRTLLPHFGIGKNWSFVAVIPLGVLALLWVMASKLNELEKR